MDEPRGAGGRAEPDVDVDLDGAFRALLRDVGPRVQPAPVHEVFRTARRRRARRRAAGVAAAVVCAVGAVGLWGGGTGDRVREARPSAADAVPAAVPHGRLERGDLLGGAEMPQVARVYGTWTAQEDRTEELSPICLETPLTRLGAVEVIGRWSGGRVGDASGEQIIARFPDEAAAIRVEEAFVQAMPSCRPNPMTTVLGPVTMTRDAAPAAAAVPPAPSAPAASLGTGNVPSAGAGHRPESQPPAAESPVAEPTVAASPAGAPVSGGSSPSMPARVSPSPSSSSSPAAAGPTPASAPGEPEQVRSWLMGTTYLANGPRKSWTEIGIVRDVNVVSVLTVTWSPAQEEAGPHPEFTRALELVADRIAS